MQTASTTQVEARTAPKDFPAPFCFRKVEIFSPSFISFNNRQLAEFQLSAIRIPENGSKSTLSSALQPQCLLESASNDVDPQGQTFVHITSFSSNVQ